MLGLWSTIATQKVNEQRRKIIERGLYWYVWKRHKSELFTDALVEGWTEWTAMYTLM